MHVLDWQMFHMYFGSFDHFEIIQKPNLKYPSSLGGSLVVFKISHMHVLFDENFRGILVVLFTLENN